MYINSIDLPAVANFITRIRLNLSAATAISEKSWSRLNRQYLFCSIPRWRSLPFRQSRKVESKFTAVRISDINSSRPMERAIVKLSKSCRDLLSLASPPVPWTHSWAGYHAIALLSWLNEIDIRRLTISPRDFRYRVQRANSNFF